jgi:hypothetical protein
VTSRRRRHDRRARTPDHPEPPRALPPKKGEQKRRAEFQARMARIARTRTIVGLAGFVPLFASVFCVGPLCDIPREIYLGLWAAIFGTFLGLTFRMWRERRAFNRAGQPAA